MTPQMLFGPAAVPADTANAAELEKGSLGSYLKQCERQYLESRLSAHGWRIGDTASSLGIGRKSLWEKMKKLEIDPPG
jgi:DNA-binding NtrC family response regulator